MTIQDYERRRREYAMQVQSMVAAPPTGSMVRSPDRPLWGAIDAGEAAKRLGVSRSQLLKSARASRRCRGVRWHMDGQAWDPQNGRRPGIAVRCVETDETFCSVGAAIRWMEKTVGRKVWPTQMRISVQKGYAVAGYHFAKAPTLPASSAAGGGTEAA